MDYYNSLLTRSLTVSPQHRRQACFLKARLELEILPLGTLWRRLLSFSMEAPILEVACRALCDLCPLDPNLGPSSYSRLRLLACGHISYLAVMGLTRQSPHLRAFAPTVISALKANCTRARGCPSRLPGCTHTAPLLTLWSRPGTFCLPIFLL